jgi:very-short-patch-repair endonuclease
VIGGGFMTELYNKTSEKEKRRSLRHNMPPAEKLVWGRLRDRQVEGCKFRRQYSIGIYVVDFYAPELKLAVEIDGESHFGDEARIYDIDRQSFLEATGVCFLRFTNQEVYKELDGVIEAIGQMICRLREEPHPSPPLAKGRGPERRISLLASEEPHPNPDLAKGRGQEVLEIPVPPLSKGGLGGVPIASNIQPTN